MNRLLFLFPVPSYIDQALHHIVIEALLPNLTSAAVCSELGSDSRRLGKKNYFKCSPGTIGSTVRIRKTEKTPSTLVLCEVEVYGGKPIFCLFNVNKLALILDGNIV